MPHAFVRLVVTPNEGKEDALAHALGADEEEPDGREVFSRIAPVRLREGTTLDDLSDEDRVRFCRNAWSCGPDPVILSSLRGDDDRVTIEIQADAYPNRWIDTLFSKVALIEAGADPGFVSMGRKEPGRRLFQIATRRNHSVPAAEKDLWQERASALISQLDFPDGAVRAFGGADRV